MNEELHEGNCFPMLRKCLCEKALCKRRNEALYTIKFYVFLPKKTTFMGFAKKMLIFMGFRCKRPHFTCVLLGKGQNGCIFEGKTNKFHVF